MAQLTPNDILEISEPVEAIYQRTVDELLINIAHHFNITGWERTRYWEIKKLSEMGALTKESAAIIAKNTQMLPSEIEKAFLQVSEKACLDIDPQLRQAAEKGLLQNPQTTPSTSILMRDMVQSYVDQAVDTCNMVNTTMLESTRQAYLKGITTAVNEAMLDEAKQIVEAGAFEVVTGTETRVKAIRKAMNAITSTGITGFYDKAGRKWSAEAYSAMVIRTTAHNAAIQAVKTRQQEFGGGDIFQVSSHPAARPLCYPYQGKFFSWSSSGEFTDGAGHTHKYDLITESSYGEPAGLFGINCGHHPIPMIPNFSYPQDGPAMDAEENAKAYEESQKQRQYERNIREAKRDLEIAKATGDAEAIKAAEQKVAREQANMRAFTKETGRPRRYDREKIAGTKDIDGYRGYRAQFNSDIPVNGATGRPKGKTPTADATSRMQSTLDEAYETHRIRNGLNAVPLEEMSGDYPKPMKADFGKLSDKTQDAFADTIGALSKEYDTTLQKVRTMTKEEAILQHRGVFATVSHDYTVDNSEMLINPLKCRDYDAMVARIKELTEDGYIVGIPADKAGEYIATHEFAHTLIGMQDKLSNKTNWLGANYDAVKAARKEIEELFDGYVKEVEELTKKAKDLELRAITAEKLEDATRLGDAASEAYDELAKVKLSDYSMLNADEFMAEAFTNERIGNESNDRARAVVAVIDKYFRR